MTYALPAPDNTLPGLRAYWQATSARFRAAHQATETAPRYTDAWTQAWAEYRAAVAANDAAWEEYDAAMKQHLAELEARRLALLPTYTGENYACPF